MNNQGKDYRRYQILRIYKKRLKRMSVGFNFFLDIKDNVIYQPNWFDLLQGKFYIYKNVSTTKWDSQYRSKWSSPYYGNKTKSRNFTKKETIKIIKESGY